MIYRTIGPGIRTLAAWSILLTVLLTLIGQPPTALADWRTQPIRAQ